MLPVPLPPVPRVPVPVVPLLCDPVPRVVSFPVPVVLEPVEVPEKRTVKFKVETTATTSGQRDAVVAALNEWLLSQ